jgi:hypothetical protein
MGQPNKQLGHEIPGDRAAVASDEEPQAPTRRRRVGLGQVRMVEVPERHGSRLADDRQSEDERRLRLPVLLGTVPVRREQPHTQATGPRSVLAPDQEWQPSPDRRPSGLSAPRVVEMRPGCRPRMEPDRAKREANEGVPLLPEPAGFNHELPGDDAPSGGVTVESHSEPTANASAGYAVVQEDGLVAMPARTRPSVEGPRRSDGANERVVPILRQPQGQRHEFVGQGISEDSARMEPRAQRHRYAGQGHRDFRPARLVALPPRPHMARANSRSNRRRKVLPRMCGRRCGSRRSGAEILVAPHQSQRLSILLSCCLIEGEDQGGPRSTRTARSELLSTHVQPTLIPELVDLRVTGPGRHLGILFPAATAPTPSMAAVTDPAKALPKSDVVVLSRAEPALGGVRA